MENKIINHLSDTDKKWFAVKAKFKSEKYLARLLQLQNIEAYVPLVKTVKRYGKKLKTYELPLIYNYVFVHIYKAQYLKVLEQPYVYRFIRQGKHLISIPPDEINILKHIVGEQFNARLASEDLTVGDDVEIIAGKLTGLTGILISRKGNHNMLVQLHSIGLQFLIEIDSRLIVKKESPVRA